MEFKSNNCIGVKVKDLAEAEKFYSGVLGFKVAERYDNLIAFNSGYFILFAEKSETAQSPVPSFSVKDIKTAKQELLTAGCTIVTEGNNYFWFKDPFGFIFDVIEQKE